MDVSIIAGITAAVAGIAAFYYSSVNQKRAEDEAKQLISKAETKAEQEPEPGYSDILVKCVCYADWLWCYYLGNS